MRAPQPRTLDRSGVAVPAADTPSLRGLLSLAVGVVVVAALYFGREVLIPIPLAVLLSFLVAPLGSFFRRRHFGRVGSVIPALALPLVLLIGFGAVIITQASSLLRAVPAEQYILMQKVQTLQGATIGSIDSVVRTASKELEKAATPKAKTNAQGAGHTAPIKVSVVPAPISPAQVARNIVLPVAGPLALTFMIFVVAGFILIYREDLRDRMIRIFGSRDLHRTTTALDDAAQRLSRFFLAKFLVNAAVGAVIGAGLAIIGIPGAILWGVLITFTRFVPYIGSFVAGIPPILLAAGIAPSWSMVVWTAVLFVVVEAAAGQFVEPLVYGRSAGLSPTSVIVAAIFWGWLWGLIGLLLSTPLTLCVVVLARHVERLEFLDVLLGDQPALSPAERFYQRALAGDPDEAIEQAEETLRQQTLTNYYDDVVLPALRFAAADSTRGILYTGQLRRVEQTLEDILDGLADHHDKDASETVPMTSSRVLCVPGRGPLDDAGCAVLAQLLARRGATVRQVEHDAASRQNIAQLDAAGIDLALVVSLDIARAPSSFRYLVRRLQRRLPEVPIVAGFWATREDYERAADFQAGIGAQYYPTSLLDAVEGIVGLLPSASPEVETSAVTASQAVSSRSVSSEESSSTPDGSASRNPIE